MSSPRPNDGFTLIEIILILAIAGLIMLIVFLALAGAQRARRDLVRKEFAARFYAGLEEAKQEYGGYLPVTFVERRLMSERVLAGMNGNQDPLTGDPYVMTHGASLGPNPGDLDWNRNVYCAADGWLREDGTINHGGTIQEMAVAMKLESGRACFDARD